jgi:hypothetical protein
MYSVIPGKAIDFSLESIGLIEAVAAIGCERTGKYPLLRVKLQTMPLDYYAD